MRTLEEELEVIKNDNTKIGIKPPKVQTLSEVSNTTYFDVNDGIKNFAPALESDLGNRLSAGFDRGIQDLKNIPEQMQIYGGQALMSIGGFIDSEKTVSMGRELIKSAYGELQADEKKYFESAIPMSDKDMESFGYGLGQGIANYGSMLAVGYVAPVAGIGLGTALEVGQKAEEKIGYHIEETGDTELNKYTSQKAQKDTLYTTIYGVGSAIIEKKFGLGEQLKMVKMPITSKLKHVVKTMVSEGGTETLQELFATGLDWKGGYIDSSKLPERFMGALKEGAIGAVLGGGMGVASAINHRSQAKAILREQLKNTVPEKDLDNVVDGIYESANDSMTSVVAQELIQSESLRNKHGAIYESIKSEISKQIKDTGAFADVDEMKLSQYIESTAKMFADQVLGEANKRKVVIDEVLKASEIVYKDGKLYLQGATKKTKLKRLKEKTPSLLQFIRSKGGVIDEGGELKMMDASKQYIGLVNKNGVDLDTMGEALWEAGYFTERPTVAELLDLIDSELRGTKHYPLGYVEQKGVSQAENEAMLDNAISEYAEVMEYDISKMSFEEKQQIYEQMQRNLYASEEPIVEGEEVVEDFGFTDNEFFQVADEMARLDDIHPEYKGETININGVEKTVYNSTGERIAKSKEALESFYNWFGDSKVVDEQGRPLVVYHGTNELFDTFDTKKIGYNGTADGAGFNFTTSRDYAESFTFLQNGVMPLYLKIENPVKANEKVSISEEQLDKIINRISNEFLKEKESIKSWGETAKILRNARKNARNASFFDMFLSDVSAYGNEYNEDANVYSDFRRIVKEETGIDGYENDYKGHKVYVAFEPNQIKSTSNRGTYSESDNIYYQFAGERAATAVLDELNKAKQLETDGVDNEEIRQQTGWFKGADGKWRFEISDKEAEFIENPKLDRTVEYGSVVWRSTLKDILKHDKLYQAYPEIADIEVIMTSGGSSLRGVTIDDKIGLNTKLLDTPDEAIKTLMHEIQHIIQSIEGFSSGGSTNAEFIKEIKKHLKISAEASRDSERLEYFEKKLGSKQKAKDLLQKEWIANKALQKSFDEMGDISPEAEKTNDEYLKLVEEYGLTSEEMRESWNTPSLKKYNLLSSMSDGEVYERIYGEIEARNTANRLDFSEEQRKQTPIEETQLDRAGKNKITNEEAVIVFDGVDVYSFEERPNKVYSVFDLKVGDSLKAFGVVEEINQTDRQIKIGGQWHSMFMLDMEANRFGLTLGNKEEIDISEDVEEEVKKVSDNRSSVEEQKPNNAEYNKIVEDYFGVTDNLNLGGYILTDGNLLDLSGKKLGSDGRTRAVDHREISDAFDDYSVSMEDFINSGNIRYMPESNSILMADVPNSKQYKIIEKIINRANGSINIELMSDANNWGSFNDYSRQYPSGTSLSTIKRDVNAFYKGEGVRPVTQYYQVKNLPKQEKKLKGSFDALTKSIKITSESDFSTYQHEFAHFWLDNIWNYANSGLASEGYIKQFNDIKKWLGVKGNYLTREQHEKFARAYEKYLYKGTYANSPMGSVFGEYENFIREVYDSIAEIDTRAGKKYKAIPKVVYDFFNSMTSGNLPYYGDIEEPEKEVKKEVKEVKEFVAEETKILEENRANYSLKPVQTDTKTGYLTAYEKMTGEKVEAGSIELKEQMEKAQKFVSENQEQAKRIVEGLEPAPDGMLKNTIYIAYNELQKRLGNTQNRVTSLLNQAMELRRMGQEIVSQKIAYADDTSPLYWIRTVQQNKVEALADASGLKVGELSEKINSSIKAGMKDGKSAKDIAKELRNELGVTELFQEEVYPTNETDVASYNYIYKYVNEQLGLSMSMAEAETITRKADDMLASLENSKAKNGNPSVDFFVKQKDLENYANSLAPSSNARVLVSVIGRGNLLTSIKSPITNIISNFFVGAYRGAIRRINLGVANSIVSPELIKENKMYSWEVFRKTGYNVNNITPETPRNTILGEKLTHSEGKGIIRWFGKKYEEYIYKWSLGAGDVLFKDYAFTDYVALKATKLANGDVNKANAIFKDACLIEPQTDEGKQIRQEAIDESLIATFQNKGAISEGALKARSSIDFGVGFGEIVAPFVKTPANIVSMGLKAGFGSVRAIASEIKRDIKAGKILKPTKENIDLVVQNGLGLLLASMIINAIDDDDYMPPYALATSKDKQLAKELNIPFNAVKIGNTWVSLDYLGALASPLVGLLQARREEGFLNNIYGYSKSAGVQALSIPAFGNISDLFEKVQNLVRKSGDEVMSETGQGLLEQAYARVIPAIFSDIAKALDSYERETKGDEIITKIPFARERAFEKISVTSGKAEELGNPIYDILFGSRVKEQVSNDVADELQRLNNAGWGVSLTTVTRSGLLSELDDNTKQKVREDFAEEYSKQVKRLIKTPRYKRLSDEDKMESVNKVRRSIIEKLKKRYLKKRKK